MTKIQFSALSGYISFVLVSVLVRKRKTMQIIIFFIAVVIALGLLSALLLRQPSPVDYQDPHQSTLDTESVDQLELWIEERQGSLERGLGPINRAYFK